MAARLEPVPGVRARELVDLRKLSSIHLENLLEEETREWDTVLDWDFKKSADLVRRFLDLRALSGCALIDDKQAVGYSYFVLGVLAGLVTGSQVRRIEAQLMMILPDPDRPLPRAEFLSTYERNFMLLDLDTAQPLPDRPARRRVHIEKWSDHHHDAAAQLIASAYASHIDSRINDQYRSVAGARRFLYNIVQYPGCGSFFRPASYVAFDLARGWMSGLSLTSVVGPEAGHITQICVAPEVRGTGVGYELLRRSLITLREHGCKKVSLTVTAVNREAVSLYERTGFRTIRTFCAYVWEGFARG
jgi:ribosomal protein S18 acetylase RimI-like enzyme